MFETIKLWGASDLEKITRDEPVKNSEPDFCLSGIKGEVVSSQIIITSLRDFLVAKFEIKCGDLVSENNDVLPSSCVKFYLEKYVKIWNSSFEPNETRTVKRLTGEFPDALIPMDKALLKNEAMLLPRLNQGIWIDICIPNDAPKGVYIGKIDVSIGDEHRFVEAKVKVYDISMPSAVHAKSMYSVWNHLIKKGEDKCGLEIEEKYYNFLSDNRLNPTEVPNSGYSNAKEYAEYIVKYAKDERVTNYRIPLTIRAKGNVYYAELSEVKEYLTAMAKKQQELRVSGDTSTDLFKKAFWYTIDEPDYTGHMDDIAPVEKVLIQAKNEVAAEYPEFADGVKKVAHIMVTQTIHTECAGGDADGGIQTWCAQLHSFDSKKTYELNGKTLSAREFIALRRSNPNDKAAGEDIWWYHCNQPENPYPTDMIDDNLISMRLLTWMQYSLDISGVLSWCVNYYQKYWEIGPTERNVWEDPVTMGRCNGDGFLLYPGKDYGVDGPIGSIRLSAIRASKQDYEYFYLLNERLKGCKDESFIRERIGYLISEIVKNDVIPVIDGNEIAKFHKIRERILNVLELSEETKIIDVLSSIK